MLQNLHFFANSDKPVEIFLFKKNSKCLFAKNSQTILQIRTDYYLKIMWEITIICFLLSIKMGNFSYVLSVMDMSNSIVFENKNSFSKFTTWYII